LNTYCPFVTSQIFNVESWLPDANVYDVVGFHYIKLTFLSCPNRVDSLSVTSAVNSYGTYHTLIDVSIDEVAII